MEADGGTEQGPHVMTSEMIGDKQHMRLKNMRAGLLMAGVVAVSAGIVSVPAGATATATTFGVSATVAAICTVSTNALAFGTYSGTVDNVSTTLSVTCTNSTAYNVGLDAGGFTGATVTTRKMTGANGGSLAYALYSDSGHAVNWGNTSGTDTVAGTGNGSVQSLTIYGQISGGQYPTPGSFSDTVTATVYY